MQKVRTISQLVFLVIFISLIILGKAQFWMGFIFLSILLSTYFGRYYCGWACPINTLMRPTIWITNKFGLPKNKLPDYLRTEKPRYMVLFIFLIGLAYMIYTITQGRKFPLPLIVIPFGLLVTIFISPNAWHRYLCPWGTLFSLTGRFARLGFRNSSSSCIDCGKCEKICPADTVVKYKKRQYNFKSKNCLLCFECQSQCPQNSVSFSKVKIQK